jgi:hypothetical protein
MARLVSEQGACLDTMQGACVLVREHWERYAARQRQRQKQLGEKCGKTLRSVDALLRQVRPPSLSLSLSLLLPLPPPQLLARPPPHVPGS